MKILIEESVLRQALEALLYVENNMQCEWPTGLTDDSWMLASDALRFALDAAEKVEPVAWMDDNHITTIPNVYPIPLYTNPALAVPEETK